MIKEPRIYNGGWRVSSVNGTGKTGPCIKGGTGSLSYTSTKFYSKLIKDLNARPETIK